MAGEADWSAYEFVLLWNRKDSHYSKFCCSQKRSETRKVSLFWVVLVSSVICFFHLQESKSTQSSLCEFGSQGDGSGEPSVLEVGISNRTEF